jgi:hypothetical protein
VTSSAGASFGMQTLEPQPIPVIGQVLGNGQTALLDPVYIFKGKLHAAATRGKFHDSADLRWLEGRYIDMLRERRNEFALEDLGLAMKRYPELELVFNRIGVNITAAQAAAAHLDPRHLPPPQRGDVQKGLLR